MPRIGTRKLYFLLKEQLSPLNIGRDKLFRILRANGLLIRPKKRYHVTTDSHHRFKKHGNMAKDIKVERPDQLWVSDITYVGTRKRPSYLALVTDAYSKKILGHDVSGSLAVEGSVRALEMAIGKRRANTSELIHHSDRGLQYCSNEYQELLQQNGIKPSMTEVYDPYENAVAERVNGILKQEFNIHRDIKCPNVKKKLVESSIEIYNGQRPHLSNYMLTPNQMHNQNIIEPKSYKSKSQPMKIS